MLIKNFKRQEIVIQTLMGNSVRFAPGVEVDVPESLIDECLKRGLMPSDDFKQAVKDAAIEEAGILAKEDAAIKAVEDAIAEKRAAAVKKGAATKAANKLKKR